ncbi:MAG: ribonuclease III, partial [Gammaproteobacteria bacterium]|nr:ribonuclease III [Gammaproteobacteria bacterium]
MTERPGAPQLDRLQRALNYRFADERLLIRALTHKSA